MKQNLIAFFLLCSIVFLSILSNARVITIDGTYQGENIYVQNPYNSLDNNFCISEVYVNDRPFTEINSSAFEILLMGFKKGQYVNIKINYKNDCKPRILNAEAIRSKSTFEIVSFKADEYQLKWTVNNESNEEPLLIEQFRNNKWVEIGKVIGKGPEGYNNYSFEIKHFSGINKYRIKQRDIGNRYRYSDVLEYKSNKKPIDFYPKRADTEITLTEKVEYEIYDKYGNRVKKDFGNKIDVSDLEEGIYWLNIDNKTTKFLKK